MVCHFCGDGLLVQAVENKMTERPTLDPDVDVVRQGPQFSDQPLATYDHRMTCPNCGGSNFFYIRKGKAIKDCGFECANCGVFS